MYFRVIKRYLLFLFFSLFPFFSLSQTVLQYNANVYNGLPSNHVYSVLKDNYGYLWLSTDKGVARYNGYDFKIYNVTTGLPNSDIWGLYEDSKKRLWVYTLSAKVGYIKKGKYVPVYLNNINQVIYPTRYMEYKNGILFTTISYHNNKSNQSFLCYEQNDTVSYIGYAQGMPVIKNDEILEIDNTSLNVNKIKFNGTAIYRERFCEFKGKDKYIDRLVYKAYKFNANRIEYKPKGDYINIINADSCSYSTINISKLTGSKEHISYMGDLSNYSYRFNTNYLFIITNRSIYLLDSSFKLVSRMPLSYFVNGGIDGYTVTHFLIDSFWHRCLTSTKGLYINYDKENHFKKTNVNLSGYKYVGRTTSGIHYWWNNSLNILVAVRNTTILHAKKYTTLAKIRKIVPYNNDSSLLLTEINTYWLQNKSGNLYPFFIKNTGVYGIATTNNKQGFFVTSTGFLKYSVNPDSGLIAEKESDDFYNQIIIDAARNAVWGYSNDRIFIYKDHVHKIIVSEQLLNTLGIHKIENIIADHYGNVFIKDYEGVFVFDPQLGVLRKLFSNYRLNDALFSVKNNVVIVAGKFGVLFIRVSGAGKFSAPIVYPNIKNACFSYVNDMQINDSTLLLGTDMGMYTAVIPTGEAFNNATYSQQPYKFILSANDDLFDIKQGDTINIDQKNRRLQFDIINAEGNGKVNYSILLSDIDSNWHELNSTELNISAAAPGKYYTLSVMAYDNIWRSGPVNIHLYVLPYWWQTVWGKNLIVTAVILLVVFLMVMTMYITRKMVAKKNAKKNLLLELELKSMHSQINPHFIFNTLTSALDFINKRRFEEAYIHISRFSRLLRANLKSSRNRYVLLADEIENLRNYIELQQTRFTELFSYKISVDEKLEPGKVNIPSLLLQPIVENAINHGLIPKEKGGILKIEFSTGATKNEMICTIDDNGIGRKAARQLRENNMVKRESYGDSLIKELITVFNTYEKMGIEINYIDKEAPLTGTIVKISIKNPHYDE